MNEGDEDTTEDRQTPSVESIEETFISKVGNDGEADGQMDRSSDPSETAADTPDERRVDDRREEPLGDDQSEDPGAEDPIGAYGDFDEVPPIVDPAADQNQSDTAADQNQSDTAADQNQSDTAAEQKQYDTAAEQNQSDTAADQNQSDTAADQNQSDTADESTTVEGYAPENLDDLVVDDADAEFEADNDQATQGEPKPGASDTGDEWTQYSDEPEADEPATAEFTPEEPRNGRESVEMAGDEAFSERRRRLYRWFFDQYTETNVTRERYYHAADFYRTWSKRLGTAVTLASTLTALAVIAIVEGVATGSSGPAALLLALVAGVLAFTNAVGNYERKHVQYFNAGERFDELFDEFDRMVKVRLPDPNEADDDLEQECDRLVQKRNRLAARSPQLDNKWYERLIQEQGESNVWRDPVPLEEMQRGEF